MLWGDSTLMISKPGPQTGGLQSSLGSKARAGFLTLLLGGVSESRTPRASLNSVGSFPLSPTGMGEGGAGREVGKGSTHRGVMLWFGLLAGMSWQSVASAPPNTYEDSDPYSGRSAPSQGIPNWSLKAGGVLE